METRAQSSMDTLLVMGFVVVVSMAVLLPYVGNQALTNSSLTTKLMLLPFLEKNPSPIKISLIEPQSNGSILTMRITTKGDMSSALVSSIQSSSVCADVCAKIRNNGPYSSASFTWVHFPSTGLSNTFCSNVAC